MRTITPVPMFLTGNPETELLTSLYAPGTLGMFCEFNQGTSSAPNICRYRLVKLASSITTTIGAPLVWTDKSAFTVSNIVANRAQLAGIARIVAAAAEYIWILTNGDREVHLIDSPTSAADAAGKPVVMDPSTAGKADVLALTTAPTIARIGSTLGTQDGTSKRALCRVNILDAA